jgi:hypothetical protein
MRSKLVPAVQITSNLVNWVLLIGVIMAASGNTNRTSCGHSIDGCYGIVHAYNSSG